MKTSNYTFHFACMSVALLFYACGGGEGNTGAKVTQIDSVKDSVDILQQDQIPDPYDNQDFATENAVKVEVANTSDFNWEDFRNELAAKEEAIGEGFYQGENEVATSWQRLDDQYAYQTLYRYRDGELWLQTYYKGNNPESPTDSLSNEEGKLLTREGAKNPEFKNLWNKMEETAQNLFD